MLNFYPGPSRLYDKTGQYMQEAVASGILERNHRSPAFEELLAEAIEQLRNKLAVPPGYSVYFTSSATECWEIVAQSLLQGKVQFLYNGAFGKKWFKYAVTSPALDMANRKPKIRGSRFMPNQPVIEAEIDEQADFFCLAQCETSNGTAIRNEEMARFPQKALKCIDATSSMAGQFLDFHLGDVWFASVQKAFGLPSGLGVMICSPRALAKAKEVNDRDHYNSLLFIDENFRKNQTHYTPNILAIYLLNALMKDVLPIVEVDRRLGERAKAVYSLLENHKTLQSLAENPITRAKTVLAIQGGTELIAAIKHKAEEKGIILGNGYGEWKDSSFRIANFPAIPDGDFGQLTHFLQEL